MITKTFVFLAMAAISTVLIAACTHSPWQVAKPNSVVTGDERTPASTYSVALEQTDLDRIKNIVLSRDAVHFQMMLLKMREVQTLVSSFDFRLTRILKETEMDQLFQSKLYCKLWEIHSISDHTEDQLHYALKVAKLDSVASSDWIYSQISDFAKLDTSREAAMANLFRGYVNGERQICMSAGCVSGDISKLKNFHVDIMNDSDLNRFMTSNRREIALYSQVNPHDLEPGTCFNPDPKRKPQQAGFDWVNRNWVGSVLPAGQFVFTYDDGPHASFTRVIRDTWADAGMAKPAFFWLRQNASHLPEIVKELNDQGYVIGSHSERHADLGNLAKATSAANFNGVNAKIFGPEAKSLSGAGFESWKSQTLDREINQSVADLSVILGKQVRYFRLPFGSGVRNDLIGARFEKLDLDHFFWRVDSLDWQDKNPESIRDRVVTQMKAVGKGIVLFHDIHPQSAQAAKLMVDYLKTSSTFKAVSIHDIPGLRP